MYCGVTAPVDGLDAAVFRIPTDRPESDGTLAWHDTTLVVVTLRGGGAEGVGYTYGPRAVAAVVEDQLAEVVRGRDALAVGECWQEMVAAVRNLGRPGIASMAIAAVDIALWDLKSRLLDIALAALLGPVRRRVEVYGSGGFTSYDISEIRHQLGRWAELGIRGVKMKVGREPSDDAHRVRAARQAVGAETALMVDANGAYTRKQALAMAECFAAEAVSWFEEPVSSDDLDGLRLLRDRGPPGMAIAAGEYGYDDHYFRRMLAAGAADVLQADASRCAGITGFLQAAALAAAHGVPLSAHTAPALHLPVCCAARNVQHIEYFHDHVRIEEMAFAGVPPLEDGTLEPDWSRPGLGLEVRWPDLERYRIR